MMKGHYGFQQRSRRGWSDGEGCNLVLPLQTPSLDSAPRSGTTPSDPGLGSGSVVAPAESILRLDSSQASKDAVLDAAERLCKPLCATGNPIFEAPTLSFGEPGAYLLASS